MTIQSDFQSLSNMRDNLAIQVYALAEELGPLLRSEQDVAYPSDPTPALAEACSFGCYLRDETERIEMLVRKVRDLRDRLDVAYNGEDYSEKAMAAVAR